MKKIFYGVIAFVVVLLIAIYTILFTSFGNNIVANIAQKKIKESAGLDVNITHFNLRFSSLELQANIANMADFNLQGALSPFKLGFDLDYLISLKQNYAKNLGLNLNQNLSFGGKIQGKASDFTLDGRGYLLGSNVLLNARMYNYSPIALNLDAQNLKIEEILHLLSYPSYAKGFLNAQAKISAQNLKPDGNIIIKLDTSYINYEAIKKDFSLDLPLNSNPKAEILANVKEDKIYAVSKIYNDYLNLQTQKTLYDMSKNIVGIVYSKEKLSQENLKDLEVKLNKKFDANIKLNNKISQDDSVKIELEELGYELSFSMKALQNKLNEYILKII